MDKLDCKLSYIVYKGIFEALNRAIKEKYIDGIEDLEKAVNYYLENFIVSGYQLVERLNVLKSIKEDN